MIAARWQRTLDLAERFANADAAILADIHGALGYEVAVNAAMRARGLRMLPPFISSEERGTLKAAFILGDTPEALVERLAVRGSLCPQDWLEFQCEVNRLLVDRPRPAEQMGCLSDVELLVMSCCRLAAWTPAEFVAALLADGATEAAA